MRGTDGPIRAAVDVLVEPVTGSRSRLTISVDFTGHGIGIGKILVPLVVRREACKEMPGNMAALKQRMEAGQGAKAATASAFQRIQPPRVPRPGHQTSIDWPSVVPASSSRFVNSLRRVTVARLAATGSR